MRFLIGLVARAAFWAAVVVIVGDAVIELWNDDNKVLAIASIVLFPITIFVWPLSNLDHAAFGYDLWLFLAVAVIAYPISTFVGGLSPIDRPGDW
jgi:TctA family transporter